jgi:hypothetical protein
LDTEVSFGSIRRVMVLVVDVLAVTLADFTGFLHLSAGLVALCPTLDLFWFCVVLLLSRLTPCGVRESSLYVWNNTLLSGSI